MKFRDMPSRIAGALRRSPSAAERAAAERAAQKAEEAAARARAIKSAKTLTIDLDEVAEKVASGLDVPVTVSVDPQTQEVAICVGEQQEDGAYLVTAGPGARIEGAGNVARLDWLEVACNHTGERVSVYKRVVNKRTEYGQPIDVADGLSVDVAALVRLKFHVERQAAEKSARANR